MASSSSLSVPSEGKKGIGTDHCDLRTKNIFSPEVIDQGRCNCCWAIHAAELASALYNSQHEEKIHVKAGPQELIDYVHLRIPHDEKERPKIPDSMRCLTSSTNNGFKYMMRFGLSMEKDNPYQGKRICERKIPTPTQFAIQERTQKIPRFNIDNLSPKLWLTNFEKAKDKSEKDILEILKVQPIASAIKFTPELKMFTGKGIFNGNFTSDEKKMEYEKGLEFQKKGGFVPKKDQGDKYHAVMIVGYGTDNGIDYYIIKNTWGKNWGDDGYANIHRDLCSISHTSWPVGAKLGSGLGTQSSS